MNLRLTPSGRKCKEMLRKRRASALLEIVISNFIKLSVLKCSFDGLLDVKRDQIVKIVRAIQGSAPLRASVVENLTTGQKQTSKIEGVIMANEPVQLAKPIIGRVVISTKRTLKLKK